jgi:hypothetical protein
MSMQTGKFSMNGSSTLPGFVSREELASLMAVRRALCAMIGPPPADLSSDDLDPTFVPHRQHLCRVYNRLTGRLDQHSFWEADERFWRELDFTSPAD